MTTAFSEWLRQARYDLDTARYMAEGNRFFYAVFMCHLAIEKALKGVYLSHTGELPPKTHNLIYFLEKLQLDLEQDLKDFIQKR